MYQLVGKSWSVHYKGLHNQVLAGHAHMRQNGLAIQSVWSASDHACRILGRLQWLGWWWCTVANLYPEDPLHKLQQGGALPYPADRGKQHITPLWLLRYFELTNASRQFPEQNICCTETVSHNGLPHGLQQCLSGGRGINGQSIIAATVQRVLVSRCFKGKSQRIMWLRLLAHCCLFVHMFVSLISNLL